MGFYISVGFDAAGAAAATRAEDRCHLKTIDQSINQHSQATMTDNYHQFRTIPSTPNLPVIVCTTLLYQACCCCCICCIGGMSAGFGYLHGKREEQILIRNIGYQKPFDNIPSQLNVACIPWQTFEMNASFLAPARLAPFFLLPKTVECSAFSRRGPTTRGIVV